MADKKKTVLIVDDDSDIRTSLRMVLEKQGYRVLMASDGNLGLSMAEREGPDLVIVDLMMPKKSGFLVLEKLRQRDLMHPKIIMITANEGSRHRAYAEMLGVNDYIRKPFSMDTLLDSVAKLCPLADSPDEDEADEA
ncbi:MAG: response regulator transcription factor [Gemmataceae bacterium]